MKHIIKRLPEIKVNEQDCFEFLKKYKDSFDNISLSCGGFRLPLLELNIGNISYEFSIKDNLLEVLNITKPYEVMNFDREYEEKVAMDTLVSKLKEIGSLKANDR